MTHWLVLRTDARLGLVVVDRTRTQRGAQRVMEADSVAGQRDWWCKWYVVPAVGR
jgi:hypothetical protein